MQTSSCRIDGVRWWHLAFYVLTQLTLTACEPTRIEKGLCELDCQRDEKYCKLGTDQRQCVAKDDPRFGCASEDCSPCLAPGAKMICDLNGACVVGGCEKEFADCDPDLPGCETHYLEDPKHCGRCNNPCTEQQACSNGFCVSADAGTPR
ncbi:MAG TPA: hypothetical protein VKP30_13270 [Polyangiaceae bacterium]|nr:hypothetical protein [Polyangiaceae bacterium]